MNRIEDLFALVRELRSDIKDLRTDMSAQLAEVRAESSAIRAEAHRDFRWLVGIQLTTMAGVLAAVVAAYYR